MLDPSKATGIDSIGPKILRMSTDYIFESLTYIINLCISKDIFPEQLKFAKLIPIHKKEDKDLPNNYRPISVLPTISKIFEKHISSQITEYFEKNKLFYEFQSGFRKNHSCSTALLRITDIWLREIDSSNMTGVVYLDLSKAFDLIDHRLILQKLKLYKFDLKSLKLISSYLEFRKQQVVLGACHSNITDVKCGVPQGSNIGPLLFLIFINDLPLHVSKCHTDLFADDSTLHFSSNNIANIEIALQEDLLNVFNWCNDNGMVINAKKTKAMLIASKHLTNTNSLSLKINGESLENVSEAVLLGLTVDQNLDWNLQINKVSKIISSKIYLLTKLKPFLPHHLRILFFNGYILPYLDYCSTVWGSANKGKLEVLYKLQKRAARSILDEKPDSHSAPLFKTLNWLTIYQRIQYNQGMLTFKILRDKLPSYLYNTFCENSKLTETNMTLRSESQNKLAIPKSKKKAMTRTFQYTASVFWNSLPQTVKHASSSFIFKKELVKHVKSLNSC
ncbi:hypothetical protein SNE40_023671 [Patella caerulea]|uniref:Reverse transcriptase domain-containing protein n=1 Tax=Patella caerulea TaxID=87958 RepID=A0AAN8FVQ3_PATCE